MRRSGTPPTTVPEIARVGWSVTDVLGPSSRTSARPRPSPKREPGRASLWVMIARARGFSGSRSTGVSATVEGDVAGGVPGAAGFGTGSADGGVLEIVPEVSATTGGADG